MGANMIEEALLIRLRALPPGKQTRRPRKSLYGLWEGVRISAVDIAEARKEMWSNFPREDFFK